MRASDVRKIAEAGFLVLKKQDYPTPSVYFKDKESPINWHKRPEQFASKAASDYVCELDRLKRENKELSESLLEVTSRFTDRYTNRIKVLERENEELRVKADKWDAVPQFEVIKGNDNNDRAEAISEYFSNMGYETDGYIPNNDDLLVVEGKAVYNDSLIGELILATQTITELPPLEEKEEVEEFWLKISEYCVARDCIDNNDTWGLRYVSNFILLPEEEKYTILPFTAETEKLIGTTDEPSKKYKFMGVKSYFSE